MRQALTFLAIIEIDLRIMKTLAVISILALLTISGVAYTDQLFTIDQATMQGANRVRLASQVSGAGIFHSAPMHFASE